jgi:hypothetical protein
VTYVLFVHDRPDSLTRLPREEREAIFAEYVALQATPGIVGHRLDAASRAVTVRLRDGERTVGPDPLGRDLPLAGFYLLDTRDHARAVDIAARIPAARLGGVVEIHALITE